MQDTTPKMASQEMDDDNEFDLPANQHRFTNPVVIFVYRQFIRERTEFFYSVLALEMPRCFISAHIFHQIDLT